MNPALRDFLDDRVSVVVASRDPGNQPSITRGFGCHVEESRLTVVVCRKESAQVLDDVARTGTIAVVFSRPTDYQTIQAKGNDARIVPMDAVLAAIPARYASVFCDQLERIGVSAALRQAIGEVAATGDMAAIAFTPNAVFQQTPGPGAGDPLEGS